MELIHDLTGSMATFGVYALVASGLAMFFFKYVRKFTKTDRKNILKVHQVVTLFFIFAVIVHYLTTDKGNPYVMSAIFMIVLIIFMGFILRLKSIKSRYFKKTIYAKVIILAVSMTLLTIGHGIFEKEHKKENHYEEHSSLYYKEQVDTRL